MAEEAAVPEPEGIAAWFPYGKQDLPGWRFDVITLLAVIGESSVAIHAQTLTASTLCLLPRIIPAPQALLRPVRPQRLPEVTAKMAGVYGGTVLDSVGFFANIMHPLEELKPYAFRVLEIKHKDLNQVGGFTVGPADKKGDGWTSSVDGVKRWLGTRRRTGNNSAEKSKEGEIEADKGKRKDAGSEKRVTFDESATAKPARLNRNGEDLELGLVKETPNGDSLATNNGADEDDEDMSQQFKQKMQRRQSMSIKVTDFLANPTMVNKQERYAVPPAYYSPLNVVSFLSFLLTVAIFVLAGYWHDGTAMVAIAAISAASTVVSYASWWKPLLMHRPSTNKVPPGDVVIRTRGGAIVLIRCREEVARELYMGTEECQYVSTKYHRVFMGLGMVLLMVAVVLLGNCSWPSQALIGSCYILLNGVYWVMGLIPPKYFWDLSRYTMQDITPEDAEYAHQETSTDPREGTPSFTRTLWYAIRETKHGAWVERSGAMPGTDQWRKWLKEAVEAAWRNERTWPAVTRKNEIMKESYDGTSPTTPASSVDFAVPAEQARRRQPDEAEQVAPLQEVQPPFSYQRVGTL